MDWQVLRLARPAACQLPARLVVAAVIFMTNLLPASAQKSLYLDSLFEGTQKAIRVDDTRVQLFVREGSIVTQWFEYDAAGPAGEKLWMVIEAAGLEKLKSLYPFLSHAAGEAGLVREIDEMTVLARWKGVHAHIYVKEVSAGPPAMRTLADYLETLCRHEGKVPHGARLAWLAVPLDITHPSRTESDAQVLKRGGVRFDPPSAALMREAAVKSALDRPGWLMAATVREVTALADPAYFSWQRRDLQLARLELHLVETPASGR